MSIAATHQYIIPYFAMKGHIPILALGGAHAFTGPSSLPRAATQLNASPADDQFLSSRRKVFSSFLAVGAAAVATSANAAESRKIAEISGSGLVFKDTLVVEAFDDPKVKGVTLYVSNFEVYLSLYISLTCFHSVSSIRF